VNGREKLCKRGRACSPVRRIVADAVRAARSVHAGAAACDSGGPRRTLPGRPARTRGSLDPAAEPRPPEDRV